MLTAWIALNLSLHPSLSFITPNRSSPPYPVHRADMNKFLLVWSSSTNMTLFRGPQKNITLEFVLASPVIYIYIYIYSGNDALSLKECLAQGSSSDKGFVGHKAVVLFAAACVYEGTNAVRCFNNALRLYLHLHAHIHKLIRNYNPHKHTHTPTHTHSLTITRKDSYKIPRFFLLYFFDFQFISFS